MKAYLFLMVMILPFVLGAIVHYCDAWIYIPSLLTLGIYWLGCCINLVKDK